jgi:hypothetical protein
VLYSEHCLAGSSWTSSAEERLLALVPSFARSAVSFKLLLTSMYSVTGYYQTSSTDTLRSLAMMLVGRIIAGFAVGLLSMSGKSHM